MAKTNTSPVSGTRDFLPREMLRRKYVISVIEEVYQAYGFEPVETPVMERLDTLLGKYGEEGDQLIFRVLKRGEKLDRVVREDPSENNLADAGLRYDLTVPLARLAAEYETHLPRIFKRYQIQSVFRADRPAKGRFREFAQCDLDVVGSFSMVVEAEVISAAAEVLATLGFGPGNDFRIRLNHRLVLRSLIAAAGVPGSSEETALVAIDKLDKIGLDGVARELASRGIAREASESLLAWLGETPDDNAAMLDWLNGKIGHLETGRQALDDIASVLEYSKSGAASACLCLDPFLARGLSYYTGPIFEVEVEGFSGSAGGGGRYDNLIGMFSGKQVPACGFSLGLERILLIMEERGLFPDRIQGQAEVLVTQFNDETIPESLATARLMRDQGLRVDVYPETGKYGKQFKYADQRGIRFVLLVGPNEIERGVVAVKDLQTGTQQDFAPADAAKWLSTNLRG
jgi:histidyl-tRNA synthetase